VAEWDALGRPIKHIDPDALRILADWVERKRRGRGPAIEHEFVVVG
jgi:hypothetical protein